MTHETAGDPVSGLKWTRRTTAKLADELRGLGIHVCPQTVARLLKAMGYSLRVNHKKLAGASHPNRDQQFQHITALRERCAADNSPLISVDTKKKELVGTFRNPGAKWDRSPELVNDHDFRSDADGRAVPYGIYDPRANAGTVFVGRTADTPAFAVDCIEKWWRTEGRKRYPEAKTLQILADGGGSNSCTARAWKFNLQHRFCNRHGLPVRVAHYPPATSKWNPIGIRLPGAGLIFSSGNGRKWTEPSGKLLHDEVVPAQICRHRSVGLCGCEEAGNEGHEGRLAGRRTCAEHVAVESAHGRLAVPLSPRQLVGASSAATVGPAGSLAGRWVWRLPRRTPVPRGGARPRGSRRRRRRHEDTRRGPTPRTAASCLVACPPLAAKPTGRGLGRRRDGAD